MCGGIYSRRIICRDYIQTIFGVLRASRRWENWAYSTSIELKQPIDGLSLGDFVLRHKRIFVLAGDCNFDFIKYFSQPRTDGSLPI